MDLAKTLKKLWYLALHNPHDTGKISRFNSSPFMQQARQPESNSKSFNTPIILHLLFFPWHAILLGGPLAMKAVISWLGSWNYQVVNIYMKSN